MSNSINMSDKNNKKGLKSTNEAFRKSDSNNIIHLNDYKNQSSIKLRERALRNIIKSADKLDW